MQREAGTQAIACRGQQALRPLHANIVPAGRAAQLPTGRASPDEGGHQRVISGNQMVPQLPTRRASPCAAASRAARPTPTVARSQSPAIPRNLRQTPFRASKALCWASPPPPHRPPSTTRIFQGSVGTRHLTASLLGSVTCIRARCCWCGRILCCALCCFSFCSFVLCSFLFISNRFCLFKL